jgi:nucleoside-triphosphatase THEP1
MIFILTGEVGSGKTTLLKKIVAELKLRGMEVDGFLSDRITDGEETVGYDLFDLKKRTRIPFLRRNGRAGWQKVGPYFALPAGLAEAEKIIGRSSTKELLVIDEAGPLELEGKGCWPALSQRLPELSRRFFLVIRKSILGDYLKILGPAPAEIFEAREADLSRIVDTVRNYVR